MSEQSFIEELKRLGVKPIAVNGPPGSSHFFTCKTCKQANANGGFIGSKESPYGFECSECAEKRMSDGKVD